MQNIEKRRTWIDIYATIIGAAKDGPTKKTRLVYNANLNFNVLEKILPEMSELGFINITCGNPNPRKLRVEVTDLGLEFSKDYEEFLKKYSLDKVIKKY